MTDDPSPAQPADDALLAFFKALSNTERLRVAGTIAGGPRTASEVAAALGLSVRAVTGHLAALVEMDLALVEGEGAAARYAWDERRVRRLAAAHLDSPRARALAGATDERSRVLASFLRDGRLTSFPTGEARKLVILDHIAERFAADRVYTEREVNEILKQFADDYTTIRRALVDRAYLNRDRGVYWTGEGRTARDA
jgi:DNA-binding transcriptional ArsR family regulator